jgi:hypothetical protein
MVGRLKTAYKIELEALKAGQPFEGEATPRATPKKAPKAKSTGEGEGTPKTPKRKGKAAAADQDGGSLKKKGRKAAGAEVKTEDQEEAMDAEL